jgi:hypothetical protein
MGVVQRPGAAAATLAGDPRKIEFTAGAKASTVATSDESRFEQWPKGQARCRAAARGGRGYPGVGDPRKIEFTAVAQVSD